MMELTGTFTVGRPRSEVWEALNDASVLRAAIPGCESLEPTSEGYEAKVALKIGPVKARFAGTISIVEATVNEKIVMAGEGNGGIAGFAKGGATVTLSDAGNGTEVAYRTEVAIGGKLAQLGGRLITSTSRKLAGQFFDRLNERLCADWEAAE